MQSVRAEQTPSRVSLHIARSFADAWSEIIRPWFPSAAEAVTKMEGRVAVVTPFPSHAHWLRTKLLTEQTSLIGVKFLSPSQLRDLLIRPSNLRLPLREHLRLLLAISAEDVAKRIDVEDGNSAEAAHIAKAVSRDPDHFLRVIDQLNAAGWSATELRPEPLRQIARHFELLVHQCGFEFVHAADRAALSAASTSAPIFNRLLICGFDGAHWPLWPLLHAAVKSSISATVLLADPRDEARDVDEAWVGTWEEVFRAAEPVGLTDSNSTPAFEELLHLPETDTARRHRADHPIERIHFLVGRDTSEQARAIVALIAKFLADKNSDRIAVLFPGAGALPRLVAAFLATARIFHNDGIAHRAPSGLATEPWRLWLELQTNPRLNSLLRFVRSASADLLGQIPFEQIDKALRKAYGETLIDRIDVLGERCRRDADREENVAAETILDKIQYLPATGTLGQFLEVTRKALLSLGCRQHWSEIDRASRSWHARTGDLFSKTIYLRWLSEIVSTPTVARDDYGAHPYSSVHLLTYIQAEGQPWSHIIFAGLNDEAWPSLDDSFVGEKEIAKFNDRNKTLNRRALKRSRHGEGQWSIRDNKTLFLGAKEQRAIRRRRLMNLLESAGSGIGATANLYSDASPSRTATPNEFLSRLYFCARGRALSEGALHFIEAETRSWLKDWSPVDPPKVDAISVGRTRYAFDARRQPRSAGEYEFALRAPPTRPITLAVTQWEQVLRWPALVWMKVFLGVEAEAAASGAWPMATGQWVHEWLAGAANTAHTREFVDIASVDSLRNRIAELARRFRDQIQSLCETCGRRLPDWWISGWSNALYIADCLAAKLSGLNDWSHMAVEWPLGTPAEIPIEEDRTLRVRGRIDLILVRGQETEAAMRYSDVWVIDYKTGRQRGFNLKELRGRESSIEKFRRLLVKGKGVQPALYALAVHHLGATDVRLTVLGTQDELEENFRLTDALAQKEFLAELHRIQEHGVFGMLGALHSDFGFADPYPLATLAIDPDLLDDKWILTHPAFVETQPAPNR
jgi:hypothetical protein